MFLRLLTFKAFVTLLFALASILLSPASAMVGDLFRALETGAPLTNQQTVMCNRLLDDIRALDDNVSFTSEQTAFVNAVCSNLKREMQSINTQESDQLVLLVGVTGSGKSTLADLLMNEKLEARRSVENPRRVNIVGPNTSLDNSSRTTRPWLSRDPQNRLIYADCPGFSDNRGRLQQVKNAIYINELFKNYGSVRFLIIDTAASIEDVARGSNFIETLRELKRMARTSLLSNNISLAVTQHGEDHMDAVYLRQHIRNLALNPSYQDIEDILTSFAEPESRIAFFPRPPRNAVEGVYSDNHARENILSVIGGASPLLLDGESREAIRIAFSDFSALLINRMRAGLIASTRTLLERSMVEPIERYMEEKRRGTRVLIDRRVCTETDAQRILNLHFNNLALKLSGLRLGLYPAHDGELLRYPGFSSSNSFDNRTSCLLKIIRQRIKPDAETDEAIDADLYEIRKIAESLDCMYLIKGASQTSFVEDIFNPVFSRLTQRLVPGVEDDIVAKWKTNLAFTQRLIKATRAPRVHSYKVPTTRNSGGMRYRYYKEHYWHLPETIQHIALGYAEELRCECDFLRSSWDYDRVNRHPDLLEVVSKELKELKANARLTILQTEQNVDLRNRLFGIVEDEDVGDDEYAESFSRFIENYKECTDSLFEARSRACNVCNPSTRELLNRRLGNN